MFRLLSFARLLAITSIVFTTALAQPPYHCNCNPPNPGISGVGVRVSTYFQIGLLLFTTGLSIAHGILDSRERKLLAKTATNLLITACALLISGILQAIKSELTAYDALIVLHWSWMLTTHPWHITERIEQEQFYRLRSLWPSRVEHLPAILLMTFHLPTGDIRYIPLDHRHNPADLL